MGILGIDIGSVAISLVEMSARSEVRKEAYAFHHGLIREKLQELLSAFDLGGIEKFACTFSTPDILRSAGCRPAACAQDTGAAGCPQA